MNTTRLMLGAVCALALSACGQQAVTGQTVALGEEPTLSAQHSEFCVLTQGYYKNHNFALANTPFFSTGYTYQSFLRVAPKGDAYIILAHQYIAARANGLDITKNETTDIPDVRSAFVKADAYFKGTLSPAPSRADLIAWADVLDRFNNGFYATATAVDLQGHVYTVHYPHCRD